MHFTDSSWNDDVDTGRSSGCFMIIYMGGVVEHSSNMPDPVALSSAEAEYNEACLACINFKERPSPPDTTQNLRCHG